MKTDKYMTISEAAKYANVGYSSIWYHITVTGKLQAKRNTVDARFKPSWYVSRNSVDKLYYKTLPGEKQHTTKVSFEKTVEKYPNVFSLIVKNPEACAELAEKASPECIEAAIGLLKALGYKLYKPVVTHEEV